MKNPSKALWLRLLAELFSVPEGYEDEDGFHYGPQDLPEAPEQRVPDEAFLYRRPFEPRVLRTVRDRIAALDDGASTGRN